jgi:3-oxoacyl-[acyl-carrier-protein] synthase II
MLHRRVVVTGVGLVTALGVGTDPTWAGLCEGKSGVGKITGFDTTDFSTKIAAEIKDFDPLNWIEKKEVKKMDRFIHCAIAAAAFAMEQSGLEITSELSERTGVFIGSGIGGFNIIEREHYNLIRGGPRKISPFFIPSSIINLAAGQVSIRWGARGPNSAPCTACSSGAHAVGDAYELILRGDAEVMIAGGSEAAISPMGVGGFAAMRALSTRNDEPHRASRPFDRDRDGFVMGEGAGILILEEFELARKRDAPILAELVGYGMSGDAYHITLPSDDGNGGYRVMRNALRSAEVSTDKVSYINAHGTSTPPNDRLETLAIKRLFGDDAARIPISSTKSMIGHTLGAAGAVEAGISVLSLQHQLIPPTINYENPDPDCDLDYVPNESRPAKLTYVLSNSFGFGGTNAALLFKKFE